MSFFSSIVCNTQTKYEGESSTLIDGTVLIEGKFRWNLPYGVELLANNYWTVRPTQIFLANNIFFYCVKNENFIIESKTKDEMEVEKTVTANLFDFIVNIPKLENLTRAISSLFIQPNNLQEKIKFETKNNSIQLIIEPDAKLILGNKLLYAMGLEKQIVPGKKSSELKPGEYDINDKNFNGVFVENNEMIYLCMDVIQPIIFGSSFKPILCALNTFSHEVSPPETFHDVIQTPLRSAVIYFINQNGEIIHFNLKKSDQFLFNLGLEFKSGITN